ncbi:MAG: response regulator [Saprospiraceae bacterium]|nr:response regulator [Saprospiraceae bacterium]
MKFKTLITLLCTFIGYSNLMMSQDIISRIDFFGVDEGLSNRDAQSIIQDEQGFIWVGTRNGLNRFDGHDFKLISKDQGLQSNEINHILKDKKRLFWLIDTDYKSSKSPITIDIFNPVSEVVIPIEEFFSNLPFTLGEVVAFDAGVEGNILIITKDHRLISYDGEFKVKQLDKFDFEQVFKMWQAPWGDIWINYRTVRKNGRIQEYDLIAFDKEGKKKWNYNNPKDVKYLEVIDFLPDSTCRFLVTGNDDSFEIFNVTSDLNIITNTRLRDHFLQVDPELHKFNEICVQYMSRNGIWLVNTDKFHIIDSNSSWSKLIENNKSDLNTTTDIFEDKSQRIWVATQFGIFKLVLTKNHFRQIAKNDNKYPNRMRGLMVDGEYLWGVIENNPQILKTPISNYDEIEYIPADGTSFQLIETDSTEICYCTNGKLICFQRGSPGKSIIRKTRIFNGAGTNWAYYKDKYGKIWITNDKGEVGYLEEDEFYEIDGLENNENLFYIYQFHEDNKGRIWIVTEGGLYTLDVEENKVQDRFWRKGNGKYYLPFDNIHHLQEDDNGSFWLATSGHGLVNWNPENGDYFQFTRENGITNNNLHGIYEDDHKHLWFSTDYGLNRFNKETHEVFSFLEKDGICHNEFNRISHAKDDFGNIYFGGLNGITVFNPDDFVNLESENNPTMVITDFQQFVSHEKKLVDKSADLKQTGEIVLDPFDPFFRLSFNLLSYEDQDKIRFAYKFDEPDQDWQYQDENYLRISHLKYGDHLLRIKGQGSDGKWSSNEIEIKIKRLRPYYLKLWFNVIVLVVLVLLAFAVYKFWSSNEKRRQYRLKKQIEIRTEMIKKQNEILDAQAKKLQALDKLKTNFFTNVAHELRTPLTILLGPLGSILKSNQLDERNTMLLQNARESGHNLLALINQIMDLSKFDSNQLKINERPANLWKVVVRVFMQFSEKALIQKQELKLDFNCDKDLIILIDRQKFERVIYNYLSNAIKFTPANGKIILSVYEKEGNIILSVKDSGIGIDKEDQVHIFDRYFQSKNKSSASDSGTGIGLAIVYDYANLFKGKAWVKSNINEGTSFFFSFPKKFTELQVEDKIVLSPESLKSTTNNLISTDRMKSPLHLDQNAEKEKPTLLIVEDNPDLRSYLTIVFRDRYKLVVTRNGQEALDHLSDSDNINMIVTDLMMPVMDGYELIDQLKSNDETRHIPLIVISAKADVKDRLKVLRVGVDDYLVKPFDEEELLIRVDKLLTQQNTRAKYVAKTENSSIQSERISQKESEWLANMEKLAFEAMPKQILSVNWLAHKSYLSERQFRRRLMKITGLSPQKYINQLRLQAAREMLEKGQKTTIQEVAVAVGFKESTSFSRSYKKYFGKSPSRHFMPK